MWNRGWCAAASPVMALVSGFASSKGRLCLHLPHQTEKTKFLSEKMMGYDIAAA